ncbi:MAG: sodium:proton antiporter [Flavobacteriaceae bacterium]|jgi:Na+:H+ antiporter, NhaC family|nr:sodium:proton antiporter [Flavobacteriaceae bacterium]MBT4112660.1 sodium:proton antiporter [Flavobacteriaceae bacterium]MBT4614513.1 sodium:proton antiporter [Flavobacteriaceae bacterium]MBT5246966.1 sodium:proton antiporter [Flavobacteriaceae bacterium]MBT5650150.1 sodium:proton antiporter [Flavobacteriaceae bacterium]
MLDSKNEISLAKALTPICVLISLLAYNIVVYEDKDWFGENTYQIILLLGASLASVMGLIDRVSAIHILKKIYLSIKSIAIPIVILLLVGALAGTWKVSGVIPAMVYYGLNLINPTVFLPLTLIVTAIVSLTTGSSYTTSATVGIALVAVGTAFNISPGMTAGAVISGAYFGDKMSPLSDTTNLAPAMAGGDLYTHIKYMTLTTVPTFIFTFIVFCIISLNIDTSGIGDMSSILTLSDTISNDFYISPILFLVPVLVIILAFLKVRPVIALSSGILLALVFALIFQQNILNLIDPSDYTAVFNSVFLDTEIPTNNDRIVRLYNSGGMKGMLWTINLTICAMIFGGSMDAIGALSKITSALLDRAKNIFGLFVSTVISCLGINIAASDQYLAIVIPGKMFKDAYKERGLAPENLSRTLEDSGTVTSALIPWNTCGAYHYGVLGVSVSEYFIYAIFNWLSPIMTLIYAGFSIKIRTIINAKTL